METRANIALIGLFGLAICAGLFGLAYYFDVKWEAQRNEIFRTHICLENHMLTQLHRGGPYVCVVAPTIKKD